MKRKVFVVNPSVHIMCYTFMLAFALRNNMDWKESQELVISVVMYHVGYACKKEEFAASWNIILA